MRRVGPSRRCLAAWSATKAGRREPAERDSVSKVPAPTLAGPPVPESRRCNRRERRLLPWPPRRRRSSGDRRLWASSQRSSGGQQPCSPQVDVGDVAAVVQARPNGAALTEHRGVDGWPCGLATHLGRSAFVQLPEFGGTRRWGRPHRDEAVSRSVCAAAACHGRRRKLRCALGTLGLVGGRRLLGGGLRRLDGDFSYGGSADDPGFLITGEQERARCCGCGHHKHAGDGPQNGR